ncbi:MAG: CDP-2,3-bis-(O-geranylgeranyl)-sn-glycerol synthase [Thermoplasmata archaeon]|nr:MAG: CDP-2,3-bis-(O-geranylgeranyl)-sn-glycerol synthase [Thermoplasmata archaeon]RLF30451.1 MAG: CDP-2,3-bis-(O-geranylgeranyl)-sn-glycerol synthase [Thermoplasmata archaeon]RLF60885.1 MAG: CDP-2,3-bis-(O-geranylgeranyl)-sn-glycerol synthase [Thermoplasmata archaeon]
MNLIIAVVQALWIILPAYAANASAVIVGGGKPIDGGRIWKDGRRVLGDGKTWNGLFAGTFMGMTVGFTLAFVARYLDLNSLNIFGLNDFGGFPLMLPIIFSICFGGLCGDIIESFFKRRAGKKRGEDWYGFDQLDFVFGALLFSFITSALIHFLTGENWFLESIKTEHIIMVVIITPFLHILANKIYKKTKKLNKK